jgi:hypothetical protein
MSTRIKPWAQSFLPVLLSLCCITCGRPVGSEQVGANARQPAPFRDAGESSSVSTASSSSLAIPANGSGPSREVPFHAQNLAVGTLLSVRLNDALRADGRETNKVFTATLDEPVVVNGRTVLAQGATVAGRVESAELSGAFDRRGYLRLSLNSIEAGGRDFSVSTSTLFARGTITGRRDHGQTGSIVELESGRRLTFRLTEPLQLSDQVAISQR